MTLERLRRFFQLILSGGLLAIGVLVAAWLVRTRPAPPTRTTPPRLLQVAVASVEPTVHQEPVVGYGTVRPKNEVKIIPQVSGKLVFKHQDLAVGKVLAAGELLFEIDSEVYEARVRQADAETRGLEASVARHDQEMANLDERIANAEQMLAIAEADYLTSKKLYEVEQVGTQRDLDLVHQKYLQQKDVMVELHSRRMVMPHLRRETEAQLDAARARLQQAGHDLESTKIFCPFKARVESVAAHTSQMVMPPLSIATLTDLKAFEVSVGIDPRELRWLDGAIQPNALEREEEAAGPEVRVAWSLPGQTLIWQGRVTRFERVDEATRTARLVVEIRDIDMVGRMEGGDAETAPTLSIGMHCRAELPVAPLVDALIVPRHAIYDSRWVYVFEPDENAPDGTTGRLMRRRVPLLRGLGDHVLVDYQGRSDGAPCELKSGELVVVSPLIKPVVGMRIALQDAQVTQGSVLPAEGPRPPSDGSGAAVLGQVGIIKPIR